MLGTCKPMLFNVKIKKKLHFYKALWFTEGYTSLFYHFPQTNR